MSQKNNWFPGLAKRLDKNYWDHWGMIPLACSAWRLLEGWEGEIFETCLHHKQTKLRIWSDGKILRNQKYLCLPQEYFSKTQLKTLVLLQAILVVITASTHPPNSAHILFWIPLAIWTHCMLHWNCYWSFSSVSECVSVYVCVCVFWKAPFFPTRNSSPPTCDKDLKFH